MPLSLYRTSLIITFGIDGIIVGVEVGGNGVFVKVGVLVGVFVGVLVGVLVGV